MPDPDLVIRPSGNLSQFPAVAVGLFQFYYTDVLWPEIPVKRSTRLAAYQHREWRCTTM
ncbi:MAG: undecaprenyl diphosphate synthase family protein [Flavonifractor plautii]